MSDKNQTSDLPDAHRGRMDVSPSDDSAVEHGEEPYVCDQVKTEEDEVPINTSTERLEETPGLLNVKEETDDMSSHQTEIHCFLPADVDEADIVKVEITEDLLEALDEESSDSTSPGRTDVTPSDGSAVKHRREPYLCDQVKTEEDEVPINTSTDVSVSLDIPSQCQTADTFSGIFHNRRSRIGKKSLSTSENGKVLHKDLNLIVHQKKNTREKAFSCPECGKEFAMKSRLIRHQKSHTGEKAFSCSDCGKSFTLKLSLVRHQNIHTKEKAFICSICGKSFTQKSSLITHQNIHTGEKTFLCPECGKCFTRKSNLIRHQTMHTGEKPFLCFECGKRFIWKTSLISHQKIHTGEKVIL